MQLSSSLFWVWLATLIGVFYFGELINSNPVHHVSGALENTAPYQPGQRFNKKTGIPNNATKEEAANRDYFAFTEANFRASGVVERYEGWLKKVNATLGELAPGEEPPTEWQQFATEFWQDRDFLCGPLNQGNCDNMPTRAQIIAMYPNNRTEARFVYYVTQVYQELHHYNVLFQMTIKDILALVLGWVPDIIPAATFQQEASATEKCNFITAINKAFISAAIQLIGPITGGMLAPMQAVGGVLEELAPIIKLGAKLNADAVEGEFNTAAMGIGMALGIGDTMIGNLVAKDPLAAGGQPGFWKPASQNFLATGVSKNPYCQTFSGDYPDLNLENEQGMVKLITRLLDELVTESRGAFHTMYHGNFSAPSITLQAMKAQNWDNIRERIDAAIDSRKGPMAESIFLYGLGEAASQDHTFMPCNFVPEGQTCQEIDERDPGHKTNDYRDTVICPLPERYNGRLQCSLGHLHEWSNNILVKKTPLLNGLISLREKTPFNYTIRELGMKAFDNYLKIGNKRSGLGVTEFGTWATGFHLPVCLFPQGKLLDFTNKKEGYDRNFLGICGDFTGDETEDFFDRMNMGIGSRHRTIVFREELIPATFSLNRPRFSPVSWLAGLCRLGYAWPASVRIDHYHDFFYIQEGTYGGCEPLLKQITEKNYTMEQANEWLCEERNKVPLGDWRRLKHLDSKLSFRFKKQTERSIEEKCDDWKYSYTGTKDYQWSLDLTTPGRGNVNDQRRPSSMHVDDPGWGHTSQIQGPKPSVESKPQPTPLTEDERHMLILSNIEGLSKAAAEDAKTGRPTKYPNKIELPASLIQEAAEVYGMNHLASGGASMEKVQDYVQKRVAPWYRSA